MRTSRASFPMIDSDLTGGQARCDVYSLYGVSEKRRDPAALPSHLRGGVGGGVSALLLPSFLLVAAVEVVIQIPVEASSAGARYRKQVVLMLQLHYLHCGLLIIFLNHICVLHSLLDDYLFTIHYIHALLRRLSVQLPSVQRIDCAIRDALVGRHADDDGLLVAEVH